MINLVPGSGYSATLALAKTANDTAFDELSRLAGTKDSKGTLAMQAEGLDTRQTELTTTPRTAQTYEKLKNEFIRFTENELAKYNTALRTRESALSKIEVLKKYQTDCITYKFTPEQLEAFVAHNTKLGFHPTVFKERHEAADKANNEFDFNTKIKTLEALDAQVATQLEKLKTSLNNAYYQKNIATESIGFIDRFRATIQISTKYPYLDQAITESSKPTVEKKTSPAAVATA